ncbi:MAG: alpha/beta fold hydrolase [Pseudorhizobium sp.]
MIQPFLAFLIVLATGVPNAAAQALRSTGTANVGQVELAYRTFGPERGEAVLFIGGIGGSAPTEPDQLTSSLVDRGFRVIHYDSHDGGASTQMDEAGVPDFAAIQQSLAQGDAPSLAYTLSNLAGDAVAILDALGIERAHIAGGSMGGMVAQLVAAEYPNRTASLTLISSTTGNPKLPVGKPPTEGEQMDPPALRQAAATLAAGDLRERSLAINAPTVVIHGEEDELFPPPHGIDLAKTIPAADLVTIAGMEHLPEEMHYPQILEAMELVLD